MLGNVVSSVCRVSAGVVFDVTIFWPVQYLQYFYKTPEEGLQISPIVAFPHRIQFTTTGEHMYNEIKPLQTKEGTYVYMYMYILLSAVLMQDG